MGNAELSLSVSEARELYKYIDALYSTMSPADVPTPSGFDSLEQFLINEGELVPTCYELRDK